MHWRRHVKAAPAPQNLATGDAHFGWISHLVVYEVGGGARLLAGAGEVAGVARSPEEARDDR